MKQIDVNTKLLGLFGKPLSFTMSPLMHNAAFQQMGLNYLYIPFEVQEEHFAETIKSLKFFNFAGCNVTSPYKTRVIEYLDEISDRAKIIGAVNTVSLRNGVLKGFNTDGEGFVESLRYEKNIGPKGSKFIVLGSGGAARAIVMTLAFEGADKIYIANRTFKSAVELAEEVNKIHQCAIPLELNSTEIEKHIDETDVIINTTKAGMYPDIAKTPVEITRVHSKLIACDIIYNPIKTTFLKSMEQLGCETVTGVGMLINQGAEAFRIWTGEVPPREQMYALVQSTLIGRMTEQ
ncbi:MAG: shikimate dehydrogenase [Bacillota bacterium]|nr:MAG: shikimate dehydrogenase [Bacillota bacterium]MBS3949620.1 shikimate dehydrogenase [Peptococcaceae bacterium]